MSRHGLEGGEVGPGIEQFADEAAAEVVCSEGPDPGLLGPLAQMSPISAPRDAAPSGSARPG
jgi:hypothetical protein